MAPIWEWLYCRLGWHGIVIREGWARCDHWRCSWAEPLPEFLDSFD